MNQCLYGSEAANGAIVITTKKGKEGRVSITVNSNTEFTSPFIMPRFQTRYGTGMEGVQNVSGARSWGRKLTETNYFGYSPQDDYFKQALLLQKASHFLPEQRKIRHMLQQQP